MNSIWESLYGQRQTSCEAGRLSTKTDVQRNKNKSRAETEDRGCVKVEVLIFLVQHQISQLDYCNMMWWDNIMSQLNSPRWLLHFTLLYEVHIQYLYTYETEISSKKLLFCLLLFLNRKPFSAIAVFIKYVHQHKTGPYSQSITWHNINKTVPKPFIQISRTLLSLSPCAAFTQWRTVMDVWVDTKQGRWFSEVTLVTLFILAFMHSLFLQFVVFFQVVE